MKTDQEKPTVTEEEKPATPPPTAQELEVAAKATMQSLGYALPDEPETPAKPEEKPEPKKNETEPEKKPDEEPVPKAVKIKKKTVEQPKPIDTDELAQKVADKIAPTVAPKAELPPQTEELSPEDKETRAVFEVLAERPDYKDHVAKFDKFVTAEKKYVAKWNAANPGKEFNAEDEEHAEFYDSNEPQYETEDFIRAAAKLEARSESRRLDESRQWKENRDKLVKDTLSKVEQTQADSEAELIQSLGDDFKDVKDLKTLDEHDEAASVVVESLLPTLKALVREVDLLYTPGLEYKVNAEHPVHFDYLQRVHKAEQEIMALPEEEREWNGKTFAHIADFNKMTPEQRKEHWSIWLEPDQIKKILVSEFAATAKTKLAKVRKTGERQPKNVETPPPRAPTEPAPIETPPAKDKKRFPSTSGGTETTPSPQAKTQFTEKDTETALKVLFGNVG